MLALVEPKPEKFGPFKQVLSYSQRKTLSRYLELIVEKDIWTKTDIQSFKNQVSATRFISNVEKDLKSEIVLDLLDKLNERIGDRPIYLTQSQNDFGIDWLRKTVLNSKGELRNTELVRDSLLCYYHTEILKDFSHFEFVGYSVVYSNRYDVGSPVYRVVSKSDDSFLYSFSGGYGSGRLDVDQQVEIYW